MDNLHSARRSGREGNKLRGRNDRVEATHSRARQCPTAPRRRLALTLTLRQQRKTLAERASLPSSPSSTVRVSVSVSFTLAERASLPSSPSSTATYAKPSSTSLQKRVLLRRGHACRRAVAVIELGRQYRAIQTSSSCDAECQPRDSSVSGLKRIERWRGGELSSGAAASVQSAVEE